MTRRHFLFPVFAFIKNSIKTPEIFNWNGTLKKSKTSSTDIDHFLRRVKVNSNKGFIFKILRLGTVSTREQ